ncbi:hypothetical protein M3Y98_00639900 [Aphelenchoides besseyi]|nr:hypothetical protein M3Y98_00639900 [Aphelenchoides besseyi]
MHLLFQIMVLIGEVGSHAKVPVPVDEDNHLPLRRLCRYFRDAADQFFEVNAAKIPVNFDKSDTMLLPPDGGWDGKELYIVRSSHCPKTPGDMDRPMTPMEIERANRVPKITSLWESRVFRMNGDKLIGSSVLLDQQLLLTAAHLSFKLQHDYSITGSNNRTFNVKCVFICKSYDFALFKSDDLPTVDVPVGSLDRGDKYFIMGYPSGTDTSNPAISKGIIEGVMDDKIHLIGSPGSKRGYSGAPVLNVRGDLAGLLLGATTELNVNTTIQECLYSSAEQKYARILPISVAVGRYNQGNSDNES